MLLLWGQGGGRNVLNRVLSDGSTVANYQAGIGITGTTNASAWANQIGAAGPLLQATGANQPTINADGSLTFDGVSRYMQATFTLNQPDTIYLVGKQITWTDVDHIFDGVSPDTGILGQRTTTPEISLYAGSWITNNANFTLNTNSVVAVVINGASSSIKVDGNAATTGNAGASNMGGFTIGARGDVFYFSNIQVYEIIIRNVADSATKQAQIQTLLKSIYGTP